MRRIGESGGSGVPSGTIQMWSGPVDEIPDGYVLCDGNNGTPDLTDKFVVGSGASYPVGETGGSLDGAALRRSGESDGGIGIDSGGPTRFVYPTGFNQYHYVDSTSSSDAPENSYKAQIEEPPYYAAAYIMKT